MIIIGEIFGECSGLINTSGMIEAAKYCIPTCSVSLNRFHILVGVVWGNDRRVASR